MSTLNAPPMKTITIQLSSSWHRDEAGRAKEFAPRFPQPTKLPFHFRRRRQRILPRRGTRQRTVVHFQVPSIARSGAT
jgi:hypothetical protein